MTVAALPLHQLQTPGAGHCGITEHLALKGLTITKRQNSVQVLTKHYFKKAHFTSIHKEAFNKVHHATAAQQKPPLSKMADRQ